MPNLLDRILADDANFAFCDPDAFAEPVTYVPLGVTHGTATATLSGGGVASIAVATGGSGYTTAPPVRIDGDGSGAKATATVVGGEVTAIAVDEAGSGYTTATVVVGGIYAVVDRNPPAAAPEDKSRVPRPKMTALIQNSATKGVTAIDSGGDTVEVAERYGGTARAWSVGAPVRQDGGAFLVPLL